VRGSEAVADAQRDQDRIDLDLAHDRAGDGHVAADVDPLEVQVERPVLVDPEVDPCLQGQSDAVILKSARAIEQVDASRCA
jgi:hypothetical protein